MNDGDPLYNQLRSWLCMVALHHSSSREAKITSISDISFFSIFASIFVVTHLTANVKNPMSRLVINI